MGTSSPRYHSFAETIKTPSLIGLLLGFLHYIHSYISAKYQLSFFVHMPVGTLVFVGWRPQKSNSQHGEKMGCTILIFQAKLFWTNPKMIVWFSPIRNLEGWYSWTDHTHWIGSCWLHFRQKRATRNRSWQKRTESCAVCVQKRHAIGRFALQDVGHFTP